jgi:hypothetical protein
MGMDHPSVNAPTWSFWRLFSALSLVGSAGWTLSRPLVIAENPEQMRELYLIIASTVGGAAIVVVGALLAGGVRMGIAEASRLSAAPTAIRCATASFTPTRIGMRTLALRYNLKPQRVFFLAWALLEVDSSGVTIRRAHEDADVVLQIPSSRITNVRLGAMTDSFFRVPTLNVEVGPSDESAIIPIALLAGPTRSLGLMERELFVAEARRMLGLEVAS